MFGAATVVCLAVDIARFGYSSLKLVTLPRLAELSVYFGPDLWLLVAALSAVGFIQVWKHGERRAVPWCLFTFLIVAGMGLIILAGLMLPFRPMTVFH